MAKISNLIVQFDDGSEETISVDDIALENANMLVDTFSSILNPSIQTLQTSYLKLVEENQVLIAKLNDKQQSSYDRSIDLQIEDSKYRRTMDTNTTVYQDTLLKILDTQNNILIQIANKMGG